MLIWLCFAVVAAGSIAQESPDEEQPRRTQLVEEAQARLTQLDISVDGPPELVSGLGPEDFFVKINRKRIEEFLVDRHCPAIGEGAQPTPVPPLPPMSFLFYFDQTHLTAPGRQRALDLSRQLVRQLIGGGNQGMIVSSARRLVVVEELTDDSQRLLDAIERLEYDRTQWDFFATEEDSRVERVVTVLNDDEDVHRAITTARSYQREEHWRSDKALRRLALVMTHLAELDSYKTVVYFADTMRANAGEHYLSFFGPVLQRARPELEHMALDGLTAGLAFDKVVNTATARGIRFYPVHAQGLVMPYDRARPSGGGVARAGAVPSSSRVRFRDAQNTLANLASETGGQAFLKGESPAKISERIGADFSCIYTLSFDPTGLPEDAPLRAVVEVQREGVVVRSKGRIVVESESTRLGSRLLTAFAVGRSTTANAGLQANLVPTGFDDGTYTALLQISVPGTALPNATWELGSSLLNRDKVLQESSGSLAVRQPGVPLVLESEIELRPGPHEIVAVAHESTTDLILSEHVQVAWPNPNDQPVTCGPIALVQPVFGAFLRGEHTRTSGSLARSDSDAVTAGVPTALMGLVCRGRRHKGPLRVDRTLVGESQVEFPVLEFDFGKERCAQIRDLIPAGSLGPGYYRYTVRAVDDGTTLDEATREFVAVAPDSDQPAFDR